MAVGTAILDFSSASSMTRDTSVNIIGQTAILAGSKIEAWLMGNSTSDHSIDEHIMASTMIDVVTSAATAGVGFTIYGLVREGTMHGQFTVQWVWS
jgi:hypothetical protein